MGDPEAEDIQSSPLTEYFNFASESLRVGVIVIEDVSLPTESEYDVVDELKSGVSDPSEIVALAISALFADFRVTVTV
jgi:hypothetical protein